MRDIAPVASILRVPAVMEVNPSFPAGTVPEFIAFAKANHGKINMASPGSGSANHVFGELFKMMAGVELLHVPTAAASFPICSAVRCRSRSARYRSARAHQKRRAARAGGDYRDASGGAPRHPGRG